MIYSSDDRTPAHFSVRAVFLLLLIISATVRILLALQPRIASTYVDELLYLKIAQNLWLRGTPTVWGLPMKFSKLLYSVLLSPFTAVQDSTVRLTAISVMNALLVSSSLIPGYFLGRRVLKNDFHLSLALLVLALSPNMGFSLTYMAENLFLPLALWGFWLADRFLSDIAERIPNPLSGFMLGFFCFFLYLTKEAGGAFLGAVMAVSLASGFFRKEKRGPLMLTCSALLLGFLVPFLVFRLTVFAGAGYSYSGQISSCVFSFDRLAFVLCSALKILLFSCTVFCSSRWFCRCFVRKLCHPDIGICWLSVCCIC